MSAPESLAETPDLPVRLRLSGESAFNGYRLGRLARAARAAIMPCVSIGAAVAVAMVPIARETAVGAYRYSVEGQAAFLDPHCLGNPNILRQFQVLGGAALTPAEKSAEFNCGFPGIDQIDNPVPPTPSPDNYSVQPYSIPASEAQATS